MKLVGVIEFVECLVNLDSVFGEIIYLFMFLIVFVDLRGAVSFHFFFFIVCLCVMCGGVVKFYFL